MLIDSLIKSPWGSAVVGFLVIEKKGEWGVTAAIAEVPRGWDMIGGETTLWLTISSYLARGGRAVTGKGW